MTDGGQDRPWWDSGRPDDMLEPPYAEDPYTPGPYTQSPHAYTKSPQAYAQPPQAYAQPQYTQPGAYAPSPYAYSPGPYAYSPGPQSTNGLAIASLVTALLGWNVIAVVLGHVARSRIRQTGEGGDGLALAGMIIGYIQLGLVALGLITYLVILVGIFTLV